MATSETRSRFPVRDGNRDQEMPASATARVGAAVVAIAPLVLLAGFAYHPYISPPTDEAAIAAAAAADPTRWALAHLAIGVGYGLMVLAFLAVRWHLRAAGEDRWSSRALPPLALGSTLFAILTGMEITLAAAAGRGGDVQAIQASLFPWFLPVLLMGAVSFALGAFGFARAIARSAVLSPGPSRMVAGALLVMAVFRFLPLSPAPYVIAGAGLVGLWPLAYVMWRQRTRAAAASGGSMQRFDGRSEQDRRLNAAQAALLERFAPDTEVHRVTWSHGLTQVLELGTGPPLLLVHGGGDGAFVWAPILPALAGSHRVLAVDRPGHGSADPFDYQGADLLAHAQLFLREIVDALELPVVDIVGNGLGGLWAVAFALDSPDRVSRLVLAGAPAGVTREVPVPLRMLGLPIVGRPIGRLLMSNPTREGSRRFWARVLVAHPERVDDALLDADVAHTRRNLGSILSLIRCTVGARGLRRGLILGESWQALEVPTMILWGEADAFATPKLRKAWDAIAARNPNIRVASVPGAGNHLWVDDPKRVVDELERFLATPVRAELPNL